MKQRLLFLFPFFFACASLSAQFNWQHTNGPEGGASYGMGNNDAFAFYPDGYFLYRSNDGLSWEKLPYGSIGPIATHGSTLAATRFQYNQNHAAEFIVSHDNGDTWNNATMPPGTNYIRSLAVCNHGIYVPDGGHSLVFRSQDDGLTWDTLFPPLQNAYDMWAFDERIYIANLGKVFRTDASGAGWEQCCPTFNPGEFMRDLIVFGSNIILSTEKKLWYSHDDGLTWAFHNSPWPNIYGTFSRIGDKIFASRGGFNISQSNDFGATWTEFSTAPQYPSIDNFAAVNNTLIISTYNQGVFRWDETLQHLFVANTGLQSASVSLLAPAGNKVWACTGNGLFDYDQQQQAWNPNPSLPEANSSQNLLSTNENGLVVWGEVNGRYFKLSKNAGQTWDSIPTPSGMFGSVTELRTLKVLDNNIFIGTDDGLLRSSDFGQSWLTMPQQVWYVEKFKNKYFSASQDQIWASTDEGLTWAVYATIPNASIWTISAADDRLFAFLGAPVGNSFRYRIYASEDGSNWKYAHDGLPQLNYAYDADTGDRAYFFGVAGKYVIYHSAVGFFESLDTCKTWVPVERSPYNTVILSDSLFYKGNFGGGVFRSKVPNVFGSLASGIVYSDENNNGIQDAGEASLSNVQVSLDAPSAWSPFYFTTSNASGQFSLAVTPATIDTLRPLIQSALIENINPPYYLVGSGGSNLNFGLKLTPNINDLAVTGNYLGRPKSGFTLPFIVAYKNAGTVNQDAVVSVKLSQYLTFVDATPPPTAIFGDSLVWSVPMLEVFGSEHIFVNSKPSPGAALGSLVQTTCRISSAATDITPSDNWHILSDTLVGSFDPNEKRVVPVDGLTAAEIAAGKPLEYTIQFQNTGTTSAERVRITDLLDTALFFPSLRLESASHPVHTFRLLPSGLLEIIFEHIMLPDSNANEAGSHGYVTFSIQRKKAYYPSYAVRNEAAIYFDFNEPILTNQVSSPLKSDLVSAKSPLQNNAPTLTIFPNPTPNVCRVSAENWLAGPGLLTLQNTAGQICLQRQVADLSLPILLQTANLPDGIYLIRLSGKEQSVMGRVVVTHGH